MTEGSIKISFNSLTHTWLKLNAEGIDSNEYFGINTEYLPNKIDVMSNSGKYIYITYMYV